MINQEKSDKAVEVMRGTGAFGVRGLVRAKLFSDNIKMYKKVYTEDGRVYRFRVVRYVGGDSVIVALDGVNDRDQALALKGTIFYVQRADLQKTEENEFYVCDLIGKTVKIIGNKNIECKISNIYNFGAGELIEISYDGATFMVPFTKENFPENGDKDEIFITSDTFACYRN